jgi:hypothetical protein
MKSLLACVAGVAGVAVLALPSAIAQTACPSTSQSSASSAASTLAGTVQDSTLALIPGAALTLDGHQTTTSGPDGRFHFSCVSNGPHTISAAEPGFAKLTFPLTTPHTAPVDLILQLATVETQVSVSADNAANDVNASGPSPTISGSRLQSLADDPDDLLLELQQLGGLSGGNPANTTISVDGFQGASGLPPKSSIAYIQVNPDQFSAENRYPPFGGGRVVVYTKAGQRTYHGSLFATNSSPWENARDPFSTSTAALGKQRYGMEFSGPVRKSGSDFSTTLEHRIVNNFAVVNAIEVNTSGNQVPVIANVATPQSLWLATAQVDWQLGPKNTFTTSYSANVNTQQNLGVGGTSLAETGYTGEQYEHVFRVSDITTATAHFMHEARLSFRWDGSVDSPNSTAPSVSVAGAFTGGGSTLGPQQNRELNIEADDDAILTTKHHTIKFGAQFMTYGQHDQLTNGLNGAYTFGGGATETGIQEYTNAILGLPGGNPTAYTSVTGTPAVNFSRVENSLFIQDDWNPIHSLHIAYGLRYFMMNDPMVLGPGDLTPRLGILWSPDKKNRWTLHAHIGMFTNRIAASDQAEVLREDGTLRVTSTIYNPVYGSPFTGATPIYSYREFAPHLINSNWEVENIGGTRALPHGWNLSTDYYIAHMWNELRTENINSPLNGSPTGPRPGAADTNILQTQNSGQGRIDAEFANIENHSLKHLQFFFGGVRVKIVDDADMNDFFTPQSSTTDAGEYSLPDGQGELYLFGNATLTFYKKIQLNANFNSSSDVHYNVTTGFDNNGDGNFNDRPQYAPPGTPLCSNVPAGTYCAYSTPFGVLVSSGGTGVFPRNIAVMPWQFYLDTNLQRTFTLTRNAKAAHQQTITFRLLSSNVLNHLNVTGVGGVLGSPFFGVANTANNGRRVEFAVRYSF